MHTFLVRYTFKKSISKKLDHKKIYSLINKKSYKELAVILADASLESDDLSVSTIINGIYLKGVEVEEICDEVIEPASMIVENSLRKMKIPEIF